MTRRARLHEDLMRYAPHDAVEAGHLARMRALLESDGDPFTGTRYAPGHFTASSFVLAPEGAELLLIHHAKLGLWLQPGGHIEPSDETVLDAARREVLEEVGIGDLELVQEGLFDVDVHRIPARRDALAHEHFDVRYLFRSSTRAFAASDEVKGAKWSALGAIESSGTDESVLRAVRKLHQRGA
jgi:8-oxo-dGTP pyrophosphatase MutT (NUDIX family)